MAVPWTQITKNTGRVKSGPQTESPLLQEGPLPAAPILSGPDATVVSQGAKQMCQVPRSLCCRIALEMRLLWRRPVKRSETMKPCQNT